MNQLTLKEVRAHHDFYWVEIEHDGNKSWHLAQNIAGHPDCIAFVWQGCFAISEKLDATPAVPIMVPGTTVN